MTTTGTFNFDPSAADVTLNAFALCGVIRSRLTTEHFTNAQFQAQMLGVDLTNRQPNRWQIENVPLVLLPGVPAYPLPPQVVAVSSVIIVRDNISRVLGPLSAVDYHELASPLQLGVPTSYYFSLLTPAPQITFWLVPNGNPSFVASVQTFKRQQDVSQRNGATVDVPYRFLDAIVWGLAARLAAIYAPDRAVALKEQYLESMTLAAALDQESVPLRLGPILNSYFPM